MQKIQDLYKKYHIMPNLADHQLRVAAVAMQICDASTEALDRKSLAAGCLLHDMGNIVKFRLRKFPDISAGEDLDYWEGIQKEYIEKYGTDDHEANIKIARDIGVDENIFKVVDAIGFHNWCYTKDNGTLAHKIATYADSRVAPFGVLSLNERLEDANRRYEDINAGNTANEARDAMYKCIREVEKEIFANLSIKPEDINDESIKKYVEELRNFEF